MWIYATWGCSASSLAGKKYDVDKAQLLPQFLVLTQTPHPWYTTILAFPAEKDGVAGAGSVGFFYRIWGPFFFMYGYMDSHNDNLLSIRPEFTGIGGAHVIERCDGIAAWSFSEGTNMIGNRFRELFGMFMSKEFNLFD